MTDIKQLPENLKELEQKPRFKQFYKQHTVDQLEEKLIEAEIEYGSEENKAALTWRYMDAKGMDFDNQANDKPAQAELATTTTEETKDDAGNAQETPKTDVSNDGNGDDGQERSTDAKTTTAPTTTEVKDDQPVDIQTQETTDHAQTDTPVSTDDNSLPTIDSGSEEQPSANAGRDSQGGANKKRLNPSNEQQPPADIEAEAETNYIEVTNNGAYNFYETATGTMVKARQATKIYTTATIDKAHILRNIDQYNQTRGKTLSVHK